MDEQDIRRISERNYLFRDDFYTKSVAINLGLLSKQDVVISGGYVMRQNKSAYAIITRVRIIDVSKKKVIKEFTVSGPADDRIWGTINSITDRIAREAGSILPNKEEWEKQGLKEPKQRKAVFADPRLGLRAGGYFYALGWDEYFDPQQPVLGLTVGASMPVIWEKFSIHFEFYYFSHTLKEGNRAYVQQENMTGTTNNFLFGLYPMLDFQLYRGLYIHPKIGAGLVLQVTNVSGSVSSNFYNNFAFVAAGVEFSYRINWLLSVVVSVNCMMEIEQDKITLANVFNAGITFWL